MMPSVEQLVRDHMKAAAKLDKEHRDPKKARDFLIRAGILEKYKSSPNGVRLVKELR